MNEAERLLALAEAAAGKSVGAEAHCAVAAIDDALVDREEVAFVDRDFEFERLAGFVVFAFCAVLIARREVSNAFLQGAVNEKKI